jgi:hypothetical protein
MIGIFYLRTVLLSNKSRLINFELSCRGHTSGRTKCTSTVHTLSSTYRNIPLARE